ncbi:MAG: glycerol-3-phosphate dehydrogenase [marine bacterium B5-7]|nr:MAG: glycerol-3-phosphate dehydrogenase [marine bacterium B5-7]
MISSAVATTPSYDVVVIGGGINGCAVARDAAGRGLSVLLLEKGDLAAATSSASSKLIHGGIRYLEHYEFKLVRESLRERDVILRIAPHVSHPMRFVFPHNPRMRPKWMIRLGLFLYDHLGGRLFPHSSKIADFADSEAGRLLQSRFDTAFEYSDCWTDDARLVVLTARDARAHGANILTRTACTSIKARNDVWVVESENIRSGEYARYIARTVVNATGPWVSDFYLDHVDTGEDDKPDSATRKVKGSHLIARKWFQHDNAYILQNDDQRIVFVLPFETDFVLIGTTDVDYHDDPSTATISDAERVYLIDCVHRYFTHRLSDDDIVGSFSGVRPLYDDGATSAQQATRDYVLKRTTSCQGAGLINIFGGKLTTHRKLAEAVMNELAADLELKKDSWTADVSLPGGDFSFKQRESRLMELANQFDFVPLEVMTRWFRSYGTDIVAMLGKARQSGDLGEHFGCGLYAVEVRWMMDHEWALEIEDVLWRRSKLGLRKNEINVDALQRFIEMRITASPTRHESLTG